MKYIITESGYKMRLNCQCPMTMKNNMRHKKYLLRKALKAFRHMMFKADMTILLNRNIKGVNYYKERELYG